jgi:hypothetical protein
MDTTTTLHASTVINDFQWHKMSPQELDNYVRQELTQQLVDAIINEDLIKISMVKDLSMNTITMRTQLKIIQE